MIEFSLSEMSQKISARHLGADVKFHSVSTDSRSVRPGQLFVALQGPTFDGHGYLPQVAEKGAVAAMVSRDTGGDLPRLLVTDTLEGMGEMAGYWRQASSARLVAITGSNGKTTVKEMLASILAQNGSVLATAGNLNNEIGMPKTLLRLQDHDFAVIEMGANHPGEIDYLSRIARPQVAVITNVGRAHLEGFGSIEGVARAKGEIINGLAENGLFVCDVNAPWLPLWRELAGNRTIVTFGEDENADIHIVGSDTELSWDQRGFVSRFTVVTPDEEIAITLPLPGAHNRHNALAAVAAAWSMDVAGDSIATGLAGIAPVKGRLQPRQGINGCRLIDDSYNANPDSVMAAIDLLAGLAGRRQLVLGELAELGEMTDSFYHEIGSHARKAGLDGLLAVGDASKAAMAFGDDGQQFASRNDLIASLATSLSVDDRILVKGSRRAGMEKVVEALSAGSDN
ncbi:MAG: UDP-N-acetylmuramoyl-tripeptide--D-alanyl-D-alanine ligase [Gammaproteobacteria bacterium]|nr:UDP-N-acetylmuramoyl-tripeptide--D-alanyl-D-alanine ligase [Gammaproteobacteria bacterium]